MKKLLIIIALFTSFSGKSQEEILLLRPETNKGRFFVYWGWNRGYYTKSDIRFKGNDYDFTLQDVIGIDGQTPFALDPYFYPTRITVPQTNFKGGYFFNDKYSISVGADHMKYIVKQDQMVTINGVINNGTKFDGEYNRDAAIAITTDFLRMKHSDGLNYVNVELNRFDNLIHLFGEKFPTDISFSESVGIGALVPKTDVKLMQNAGNDQWHLAGFGLNGKVGIDITFFNHFFLKFEVKGGYINMPSILTTSNKADDRASQQFFFVQRNFLFGWAFRINKKDN